MYGHHRALNVLTHSFPTRRSSDLLVPKLPEADVMRIGSEAVREYATDLESCREFHERYDRAMDMAMQVKKAKTFPWINASNVVFPLLTQSAIQDRKSTRLNSSH